jgi:aspartyl-tRNA(Asn)/glutamyl-tRNA(Gln) amidotransferase subunit A
MGELQTKTIHELADLLVSGETSAEEITVDVLAAVDARNGGLNAYIDLDHDQALADAKSADAARAKGDARPLLGIPIAIKDVLNVKGQTCTCASAILNGYRSPYDATCIGNLRRAGFHFAGRLNMDEFAMGGSTENSVYGPARNPRNVDYVTGGSSGGTAAAVAGEIAVAAIGSDTGGSIRQPASFCGCVGLKPTYGRVSRYGLVAFASSLDQVGPLTKDVKDAAILLEQLAGHDPMDSTSIDHPVRSFHADASMRLEGMRLGMPKEYFVDGMDPDVAKAVRGAADVCAELGAEIVDVSLPHTEYSIAVYYIIATAEASSNLARFDGVRYGAREPGDDPIDLYGKTRLAGFGNEVKRRIILGTYVLSSGYYDAYYLRAQKVRTLLRRDFEEAFGRCDAIVAPVAPSAAFKIGEKVNDPLQMYLGDLLTVPANLAGIPGISVPCGETGSGLPIGLQILGPDFGEETIMKVAYAYEQSLKK